MWPWDISQLPPEDRAELRLQALQTRRILGASYLKVAVVVYAAIVILAFAVVQTAHAPALRLLIMFAMIAAGVGIFFRSLNDRFQTRRSSIQDEIIRGEYRLPQNAGGADPFAEGATGAANVSPSLAGSDGAPVSSELGAAATGRVRQVHSLSELPPELAAIPDVQKIFESAGSRGVSIVPSTRARAICSDRSICPHPGSKRTGCSRQTEQ